MRWTMFIENCKTPAWFIFSIWSWTSTSCSNVCWTVSIIVVDRDSPCHKIKENFKKVTAMITSILRLMQTILHFYIFTFYLFIFYFLFLFFWTSWSWISCMLEGGPAFFVWAISREIVRITPLTTLWLNLINAAWAACLIVITSCTEYLRKCPKFQTGWRLTISHVVSSSFPSHLVSNRLFLFYLVS